MGTLTTQVRELSPSAKEPLFRRLMVDESLSYLREKNSIIGFEIDMNADQTLSGFTLIGIQKHTIYAYVSDLNEKPRLILFPPLDKLFDPAFELLDLVVFKKSFTSSMFAGKELGHDTLQSLVRNLTPPEKEVDIPEQVAEQMTRCMKKAESQEPVTESVNKPENPPETKSVDLPLDPQNDPPMAPDEPEPDFIVEEPPSEMDLNGGFVDDYSGFEENSFDDYDEGFDGYGGYSEPEPEFEPEPEPEFEPELEPAEDPRSIRLKVQSFTSLSEVSDFCSMELGVQRPLAVNVVNKALQSNVDPEYRIDLAIKLFVKLFNDKKI